MTASLRHISSIPSGFRYDIKFAIFYFLAVAVFVLGIVHYSLTNEKDSSWSADRLNEPHWYTKPFNLKYDSKWVNFSGSTVDMNDKDEIVLTGGPSTTNELTEGMSFFLGEAWQKFASGQTVMITITAESTTDEPVGFKTRYMTNGFGGSRWYDAVATPNGNTIEYYFDIPKTGPGKKDFVYITPMEHYKPIYISHAEIQIVKKSILNDINNVFSWLFK